MVAFSDNSVRERWQDLGEWVAMRFWSGLTPTVISHELATEHDMDYAAARRFVEVIETELRQAGAL